MEQMDKLLTYNERNPNLESINSESVNSINAYVMYRQIIIYLLVWILFINNSHVMENALIIRKQIIYHIS